MYEEIFFTLMLRIVDMGNVEFHCMDNDLKNICLAYCLVINAISDELQVKVYQRYQQKMLLGPEASYVKCT